MLTFKNLQDHVLTFLDQAGDTDHGLDLVKLAIQTSHDRRLTQERWNFMVWPVPQTVAFKAGQRVYALHPEVQMLKHFRNVSAKELMRETPSRAEQKFGVHNRFHFEFVANSPVRVQPVDSLLVVVSGKVHVRYVSAQPGNDVVEEDVTNAPFSEATSQILSVTKLDDNAVQLVQLTSPLPTEILALPSGTVAKSYPQIRLFQEGHNETGRYEFYKKPSPLVLDNDIPDIPYPFSRILIYDALLELYTYNDAPPPPFWAAQQQLWERQLQQAYQEGEMIGSESRQVQETDQFDG